MIKSTKKMSFIEEYRMMKKKTDVTLSAKIMEIASAGKGFEIAMPSDICIICDSGDVCDPCDWNDYSCWNPDLCDTGSDMFNPN